MIRKSLTEHKQARIKGADVTHEWIEIGSRRWCLACGSYQVRHNHTWADTMIGPWPGYNRTDLHAHDPTSPPVPRGAHKT